MAVLPKLKLQDPFARKGIPLWRKILYIVLAVLVVAVAVYLLYVYACPHAVDASATTCETVDSLTVQ